MKNLNYEVILKLHEDDESGIWGLCHANTVGTFNAFWEANGIFHDVFEHYFEGTHPYFSDKNEMTLFGEMCASGHGIAYADLGIDNFQYRTPPSGRSFTVDTTTLMEDWVHGHCDWLEYSIEHCRVPRQKEFASASLRYWLNEYEDWIDKHLEFCKDLKKLKFNKVKDVYTYGYKTAKTIIGPDPDIAYDKMQKFLDTWNKITSRNDAANIVIEGEDAYPIHGFKFTVTNKPVFNVNCVILDQRHAEYPLDLLETY